MKKSNLLNKMSLLLVLMLVAAMTFGCGTKTANGTDNTATVAESAAVKGEGATSFNFEMKDGAGNVTSYVVNTDETTVGAALLALDMIGGEVGDYGLFVTTVLGNEPTSDANGTPYWAFYINGEYAPTGVDATDITPDATYSFVVETY